MADIRTVYAGSVEMKSPFVVASSGLTANFDKIKEFSEAGAGAIVLKSIFEEQIEGAIEQMEGSIDTHGGLDYLRSYVKSHALEEHIELLNRCRDELDTPIIASINCYKADSWLEYAKELVEAGADALELNVMRINTSLTQKPGEPEQELVRMARKLKEIIPDTPFAMKLSKNYTNELQLARELHYAGVSGLTLFNKSYMPDVNIEKEALTVGPIFSEPDDYANSIRYGALIHGMKKEISLSLSRGARTGEDIIKGILVGADNVQFCTALYKLGSDVIKEANDFVHEWMDRKKYDRIKDFKGKLAAKDVEHANLLQRSQFMKYYSK